MTKNEWNIISKIKRAKNRKKIFLAIENGIIPSELVVKVFGKSSNTYFNIVSRALSDLLKLGLVKIRNPKEKTGRMYEITAIGKAVKKEL